MKILFYLHQFPAFGGIETVTAMLASRFAEDGHKVQIVSFIHKTGTTLLEELPKSVLWRALPEPMMDSDYNRQAFLALLNEFNPNVIIFQDSYANIQTLLFNIVAEWKNKKSAIIVQEHSTPVRLGMPIKRLPGVKGTIKYVAKIVLRPYFSWRRYRYECRRRRELFDHSVAYVALSQNYAPMIERMVGTGRMLKFSAIANPVKRHPPINLSKKKHQLLFVGSLIDTKGVNRLIDIWQELEANYADWEFIIVGDGIERPALERQVADAGLKHVRFEGFKSNPSKYYNDASIFVMASKFEGWPMVLGEAMSYGCIPIAYDSFAALSDIIVDGESGFIIPPFAKTAYVKAIKSLIDNSEKRIAMARAAIEQAGQWDMGNIAEKWYALFGNIRKEIAES